MEEAAKLTDYLPLSFKTPKESNTSKYAATSILPVSDRPETDSIRTLHEVLKSEYGSEE